VSLELLATKEEDNTGLVQIATPYEQSSISIVYQSLGGTLDIQPRQLAFDESQPSQLSLFGLSSFNRPVSVRHFTPPGIQRIGIDAGVDYVNCFERSSHNCDCSSQSNHTLERPNADRPCGAGYEQEMVFLGLKFDSPIIFK